MDGWGGGEARAREGLYDFAAPGFTLLLGWNGYQGDITGSLSRGVISYSGPFHWLCRYLLRRDRRSSLFFLSERHDSTFSHRVCFRCYGADGNH